MLKSLKLTDFRTHKNSEFTFSPGLNVIVGENGSGKSSILTAIGVGLFNSVHAMKELVRAKQQFGTVEIEFEIKDQTYLAKRSFGQISSWQVFENGELSADGEAAVVLFLTHLFGLDGLMDLPTFFHELIGVAQFEMVSPFAQAPTERKKFFNRVLGVDEYDLTNKNLRAGEKFGEESIQKDEVALARLEEREQHYKAVMVEKENWIAQLRTVTQDIQAWEDQLTGKQQILTKQQQLHEAFETYQSTHRELMVKHNLTEGNLTSKRQVLQMYQDDYEQAKAATIALPDLEQQKALFDQLKTEEEQKRREYLIQESAFNTLRTQLDEMQTLIEEEDHCPVCGQDIAGKRYALLADLSLKKVKLTMPEPLLSLNTPPFDYEQYVQVKTQAAKFESSEKLYLMSQDTVSRLETELAQIRIQLSQLTEVTFDYHAYAALVDEIKMTEIKLESLRANQNSLVHLINEANKLDNPAFLIEKLRSLILAKKASLETLKQIRKVFQQMGPVMAQKLLEQINYEARCLFVELLGEHYQVDMTISDDYAIKVNIDGNDLSFNNLSGGQQVVLALAIRLALLKSCSNLSFILIDEPFDSLDFLAKEAVIKALSNLELEQWLIITHDDSFDAEKVIHLELQNGVSVQL